MWLTGEKQRITGTREILCFPSTSEKETIKYLIHAKILKDMLQQESESLILNHASWKGIYAENSKKIPN